jgi:outer membrane protein assembly factor BamB
VLWRTARAVPTVPSPVAFDNLLFYVRDGGIFTALDARTGKVLKEGRLPGAAEKFFASPAVSGGRVYLASETGKVIVIRAAAEWAVISIQDLGDEIYATPAISGDGRIYIRTSNALYCFGRR